MNKIKLLGSLSKYNSWLAFGRAPHLRLIYTGSHRPSESLDSHEYRQASLEASSISWSSGKEEVPKGFEKFFPGSGNKSENKAEKSTDTEKPGQNPFDFKKFSSGGGGGSEGDR